MIRKFGAAQAFDAEVFLAVDKGELPGQAAREVAVDDGIGAVVVGVGLFDADVERRAVDRPAIGEGHEAAVDAQRAAEGAEAVPVAEDVADGVALAPGRGPVGLRAVARRPLLGQCEAVGRVGGRHRGEDIAGIEAGKAVGVVALGLELLAGERGEVLAAVDVVKQVAHWREAEAPGMDRLDVGHDMAAHPRQQQGGAQPVGVGRDEVERLAP